MIDRVAAKTGAQAGGSAGRVQVVRGRAGERLARLWRRRKRRRFLPPQRRHGVDHRQGRNHSGLAFGGNHGAHRPRIRVSIYQELDPALRRARCTSASMPPPMPIRKQFSASFPRSNSRRDTLAGEPIKAKLTKAPGNRAPIGGLKVVTQNGWFAARPSGTEDVYKIYAESFLGEDHLRRIQQRGSEVNQ